MPDGALLDRQVALVRTLADPKAIDAGRIPRAIEGIDPAGLRLMSAISLSKRIEKIRSLAPRSFLLIDHDRLEVLADDFAAEVPPDSASRQDNADQFQDFLETLWETEPPEPAFLPDLLAYELADARARLPARAEESAGERAPAPPAFRMRLGIAVIELAFDIRAIAVAEIGAPFEPPPASPLTLALVPAEDGGPPRVFALNRELLDVLRPDGAWTSFEPGDDQTGGLERLERLGIVEIAR